MQKSDFLPDHINAQIHRPACPKCRAHMMLARIMPARLGFDLHIFKCPKCDHVHEAIVATEALEQSFIPQVWIMDETAQHPLLVAFGMTARQRSLRKLGKCRWDHGAAMP